MLSVDWRKRNDWELGKLQLLVAMIVMAFGGIVKAKSGCLGPALEPYMLGLQSIAWLVGIAGPPIVVLTQLCRKTWGSPSPWEAVQKVLDGLRAELFENVEGPLDLHRVTLFKRRAFHFSRKSWRSPRGWLVACARSDHLTRENICVFRAPDDAALCEGVAGEAFRCKDWVQVPKAAADALPILTSQSSDAEVKTYAEATRVSTAWVRQQLTRTRPLARSYAGLQVGLGGKPWGVLVVDSARPEPIEQRLLDRFSPFGIILTSLLERM